MNIIKAMFRDNKVLAAAARKGFDARVSIVKESPEYIEMLTLLKMCRDNNLTVEESVEVILERFG